MGNLDRIGGAQAARDVDRVVDRFLTENPLPGLAFGVVQDGELVLSGGRGDRLAGRRAGQVPDADTVFRIASMTKSFTATAVLQLRDEGALSLDDPVAAYLPEVSGMGLPSGDSAPVTVRQLLTMSAGLPTDDPWGDRQQALPVADFEALVGAGLRFAWPNGSAFEYSNLGYALLGRLVAVLRGQDYADAMTAQVLAPLGLSSTVYGDDAVPADRLALGHRSLDGAWVELPFDAYGSFAPMGGLFSTVRDLARWVGGFTDAFPARDDPEPATDGGPGGHPLRRASRRELQQPHRTMPPELVWTSLAEPPALRVVSYGFGLFVESDPTRGTVVGHSGGYPGFGSNMRWHPDTGLGVVVLANATYAPAPRLAAQLLALLLHRRPSPDRARARVGAAAPVVPRSGGLWPETVAARDDAERLVEAWDEALAQRLFAMNVDLDDALPRRRTALATWRSRLGPFVRDDDDAVSDAPSHLAWWLRGPGGRLRLEIRLTPQLPPQVQTFTLTAAANPSPAVRTAAGALVAAIAGSGEVPGDLPLAAGLDRPDLERQLRVAAAWAGTARLGDVVAGDGGRESTFRVEADRLVLTLLVRVDERGALARCVLRPA